MKVYHNLLRKTIYLFLFSILISQSLIAEKSIDKNKQLLSPEEKEWLNKHKTIRVAPDPSFPPIEFFDENGKYSGIAADYFKIIEKKLNVKFEYVRCKNWEEVINKAKNREVDILSAAAQTPDRAKYMLFSTPYLKFPGIIITKNDSIKLNSLKKLHNRRVAIVSGYVWQEFITKDHPEIKIVTVNDIAEGLQKVSFGSVDAMIATLPIAIYYIEKEGISNLGVAGETKYFTKLSVMTRNDQPILNSIIEKTLAGISAKKKKEISQKWIILHTKSIFKNDEIWKILFTFLIQAIFILSIIFLWKYHKKHFLIKYPEEKEANYKILFIIVLLIILLDALVVFDEIIDTPHLFFGFPKAPVNYIDIMFESTFVYFVGSIIMIFFYKNIRLRIQTENSLRESEIKYRSIFEHTGTATMILENDMTISIVNSEFEKLAGYSKQEIEGKIKWTEFVVEEDLEKMKTRHFKRRQRKEKVPNEYEFRFIDREGDVKNIYLYVAMMPNSNQSIASLIDITNLKQAEKEIKEQNEELVSINEEYLSQNEELKEAKEKAEESDRLKSAFLTNMSHEIRTPMNGILGFAELLKDPEIKSKERKLFLEVIEKSGIQLLSIINDIIDISKIETGQIEIRHNKICINDLLHELCAFFKPIVKDGVKSNCFTELPDDQSNIYTDKTKVTQILTNLINNAIKFTEKGHINVGYTLKSNYIEFYVEDTGIGIKPEAQELIFERFRQAETDNSTLYSGTGLGLSISKAYVEFLGGKIWLESKVNKGSTFYFVIPKDEAIQVDNDTHENMIIEEIKNEKIEKKTILVAEDNDVNYMYVCALLSEIDVEIVRAFDGKEAVDLVKSNPAIDLVLMDIKMPIMNGFEATREIKKFKKELPIIAVTAYALHEDRDRAIKEGCNDYLAKPFSKIQLIKLIRKYV